MTPAIPLTKLLPLVKDVWSKSRYAENPMPVAWAWSCSGYYFDLMGEPGANDRGINDDAIGFVSPTVDYRVRGNVDPSVYRKGVATLVTDQVVWYKPGWHGYGSIYGHSAFRQDSPVTVKRDGTEGYPKGCIDAKYGICLGKGYWTDLGFEGKFWTNLHRQSGKGTSSLGCQTIPADLWKAFYPLVMAELARYKLERFPCVILHGPIN